MTPATTDLNAEAMLLGGADSPRVIPVAAGTVEVTDFVMGSSTGLVDLRFFARGSAGGTTDSAGGTSPISLAPGQTIDLMICGPGLDAAEPGAGFRRPWLNP